MLRGAFLLSALFLLPASGRSDELIAPTRTPQDILEPPGRVMIFSEPPGLDVFLDDSRIGQTPIWSRKVKPGSHKLKINDLEKLVTITSSKTRQISLFKGSFISILNKDIEVKRKPASEEESFSEPKTVIEPPKQRRSKDLTLWERFINKSSPHF